MRSHTAQSAWPEKNGSRSWSWPLQLITAMPRECWLAAIARADRAHAVAAADQLEAVDRDVVGGLEVEAGLPPGVAAGHRDAERLVLVALAVEDDRLVVGAAVLLR